MGGWQRFLWTGTSLSAADLADKTTNGPSRDYRAPTELAAPVFGIGDVVFDNHDMGGCGGRQAETARAAMQSFPLPVSTESITVSQLWHPRVDADPAQRWLRGLVQAVCRGKGG